MKYQIEMLNVGDADCLILYIEYDNGKYDLILIDAGNYSNGQDVIDHLNLWYPEKSVSLAIVTHPDGDHYGGFIKMLEKIEHNDKDAVSINQFWVHDPGNHICADDVKWVRTDRSAQKRARQILTQSHNGREINLLEKIDNLRIPRFEIFADSKNIRKIGPLKILGPTKEYYESLVADFRHDMQKAFSGGVLESIDKKSDDDSTHNRSSLIFAFEKNSGDKYLFPGDAAEESFYNMTNEAYEYIADCYWLKVPHHGSHHNMSTELIDHISPRIAYISSTDPDSDTVRVLKKVGTGVYSTSLGGTKLHNAIKKRPGWSPAKKL